MSVVPGDWRDVNVCPIFKKGERNEASNYRSVSLTSQDCKMLESIIRDQLVTHLESNKLIEDSQHGFRRGRSCILFNPRVPKWGSAWTPTNAFSMYFHQNKLLL